MNRSNLLNLAFIFSAASLLALTSCKDDPASEFCSTGDPDCISSLYRGTFENGIIYDLYLPPKYDESEAYPLMIFNDGEVIFGSGSWELDTILDDMITNELIEPVIVLALFSMGNRNDWYVPYDDSWITQNWGPYSPRASEYADMVINEILPAMEADYPLDLSRTGIAGVSLGGLVSTWMGLKYPETFKYSASLSGSFWVADYEIFNEVTESYDDGQEFWFDIGTGEWNYYVPLYKALDEAGVEPGERSFYYEDKDAVHSDLYWINRIKYPLQLFYGTSEALPSSMEVLLECIPSFTQSGLKFRRMNPVITTTNAVKYSLAHAASYTLKVGSAELGTEGSFLNDPATEVRVQVDYLDFSEEVVIPMGFCR
ncbi:alpha/beta hydrolase [Balneola sp. MJW-20]|uniref:alpha/beta hydrolase n=1 Tax=Gracilimonas aurantiaca TaxID=3234185 RepID=UPI003467B4B2